MVIEKCGKGDTFVDCTGADVRISSIKFVQHDAVEGILSECPARTEALPSRGATVRETPLLSVRTADRLLTYVAWRLRQLVPKRQIVQPVLGSGSVSWRNAACRSPKMTQTSRVKHRAFAVPITRFKREPLRR